MATNTLAATAIKATITLENGSDLVITLTQDETGRVDVKQEALRAPGTNDYYAEVAASNRIVARLLEEFSVRPAVERAWGAVR